MRKKWTLSTAALAVSIFGAGAGGAFAADAPKADTSVTTVQDLVVTATRREETANKIPLAIQALGGETLRKLGVANFEQLVEFLPNVRTASHGPGTSAIYIRGLSTDTPGLQILGTAGSQPNVALYLNDAPSSVPGRNLDVYAVDLQRVEVLAGPQGTLFGASAMGGAIRYITNKPDLKDFHSGFNASYAGGSGADPSSAASAFVNIPIIEDKFAARFTIFSDNQGGYISNVAGTFQMPFNGHVGEAGKLPEGNPLLNELVNPIAEINPGAEAVHGISKAMLEGKPAITEISERLVAAVEGKKIVAYNVQFDWRLLQQSFRAHASDAHNALATSWDCAMEAYARYYGEYNYRRGSFRWQRLTGGNHTALGDCLATLALIKRMAESKLTVEK